MIKRDYDALNRSSKSKALKGSRAMLKTVAKVAAVVAFTALSLLGLHRLLGNADRAVQAESVELDLTRFSGRLSAFI